MRRPRSATDRTCRFTVNAPTRSACRRRGDSFVSFCTRGSTSTSAIGACSTPCGSISQAPRASASTNGLRRRRSRELFTSTQFPFADVEQVDVDGTRGSLQARYRPDQRPKMFYTNTPVEYWGGGRAAALTHTTIDGQRDLALPENVRMYLLAGTQHGVASFPPVRTPPHLTRGRRAKRRHPIAQSHSAEQRHAGAASRVARVGQQGRSAATEPVPAPQRRHAGQRLTRSVSRR